MTQVTAHALGDTEPGQLARIRPAVAERIEPTPLDAEATSPSFSRTGHARRDVLLRRALDVVLAALGLVLLAPVLLVVAVALRLDSPGPVLFRQRRLGRHMAPFTVHKFRTMQSGANDDMHREYVRTLIDGAQPTPQPPEGLYKLVVDDRITRVGRVLRSWSLDELPQLWNVLRGEMSLVGPRPVIPYEAEIYPSSYLRRFDVKPGLTGLWQVSGRNECSYDEMVRLDIDYVERASFRLDLAILIRTVLGRAATARRGLMAAFTGERQRVGHLDERRPAVTALPSGRSGVPSSATATGAPTSCATSTERPELELRRRLREDPSERMPVSRRHPNVPVSGSSTMSCATRRSRRSSSPRRRVPTTRWPARARGRQARSRREAPGIDRRRGARC